VRRVPVLIGLLALALACALPGAALAAGRDDVQALENEGVRDIIVARDPGLSAAARGDLRAGAGVTHLDDLPLTDTEVVRAPAGGLVEALDALKAEPGVRYAEPNAPVHAATNDEDWPLQWGLQNTGQAVPDLNQPPPATVAGAAGADIRAPQAWARSTGARQVIGVVDTGLLATHQDLQGALWTNPGEAGAKATNGIDDDHDGAIDDVRGWNALTGTTNVGDPEGHGTHVTGTIVARKDNVAGIAGVAPAAQVFPLVALDGTGTGSDAAIASAFAVAGKLKLRIVNASVDGTRSQAVENAIAANPGTLYVLAAGNGGANTDTGTNYCSMPEPNIVCVGASDAKDARAVFPPANNVAQASNFGPATVDLFAPGANIVSSEIDSVCAGLSTPANACYALESGTSMAAPHVSGTLALMLAANPALTAPDLKARLLASVAHPPALAGESVTGGRLDAAAAVAAATAASAPPPPPAPPAQPAPPAPVATSAAPPTAAVPPAANPQTTPVVVPVIAAPALGRPALSRSTLTAKRPVTIRFTLDRAATVKLTLRRGSRTVATVTIRGRTGANRYVLRTRIGARRLARGRYRVRVQARAGAAASKTFSVAIAVR
jgi:thermitase